MRLISRDPFARTELHRETVIVSLPHQGCFWCGNHGKPVKPSDRNGYANPHRLFRYLTETDSGRQSHIPGLFCSVGCMRSYSE